MLAQRLKFMTQNVIMNVYLQAFTEKNASFLLVIKVITNHDISNVSGTNCILAVVLENCEPKLSYILAENFNMCLEEYCFPDC